MAHVNLGVRGSNISRMTEGDRLPDRPPDAPQGAFLDYATPPQPRDRRLTLASWLSLAPMMLVCILAPLSTLAEQPGIDPLLFEYAFTALFCGLVFASALNLIRWTRANWKTASSGQRWNAVAVGILLGFYLAVLMNAVVGEWREFLRYRL